VRLIGLAAFAAALISQPALACSVTDEYRVPTNLELAADADLIFIGKVESGTTEIAGPNMEMTVTPVTALKGQLPASPIKLPGAIAEKRFAVLSNPLELEQAHPLAYIGGCTRYMFVKGATVLFFLTPAEKAFDREIPAELKGRLVPAGGAFSRWAEDVPTADSPWVRATRIYIAAAKLPKEQQQKMLIAERDKLRAAGDQESKLIADDIDRQLAGPNKPWNEFIEEEIKKMKARGEDPLEGLAKDR
jgi:hypothetical protein